jgi:hypothetical protein
MKNLRNLLAAITLMAILIVSATTTKAGILMTDNLKADNPQPCVETQDDSTKVDSGILVTFTGILVTFTGILVTFKNEPQTDCGILVTNK